MSYYGGIPQEKNVGGLYKHTKIGINTPQVKSAPEWGQKRLILSREVPSIDTIRTALAPMRAGDVVYVYEYCVHVGGYVLLKEANVSVRV